MAKEPTKHEELSLKPGKSAMVFFYESLVNRDGMIHGDQITHIDPRGIMHSVSNKTNFLNNPIHSGPDL